MFCSKCDTNIQKRQLWFKIIKRAYCWNCGSTWFPMYNQRGEIIGWEICVSDEEWKKYVSERREEISRVNEELVKRGINNKPGGCGNCGPKDD